MRDLTRYLGPIRELDVELGMIEKRAARRWSAALGAGAGPARSGGAAAGAARTSSKDDKPVADLKKLLKKLEKVAQAREGQRAIDDRRRVARGAGAPR